MTLSVKDLNPANYNPRTISARRLTALQKSYATFGDLSGVVFNKRTKTLVSGHQRLKTIDGKKTQIVTSPHTDQFGTVEQGHIIVKEKGGSYTLPFRIVDWNDKKTEMAANIAANAHGGEFDKEKLSRVLRKLDVGSFEIESLGLDPLTIRSLAKPAGDDLPKGEHGTRTRADDSEFPEYGEESFAFDCTCPRCGYQWNNKGSAKKAKETVQAKPKKTAIEKTAKRAAEARSESSRARPKRVG